ncbi:hypothetical protein JS562_43270, partial [Agrobacterium sp. S2]|nr:hypothetical protein [Agrobacterium sp. S2]
MVTFLTFLWRPEQHMYLKPEVTKLYAKRVEDPDAEKYSPDLDTAVCQSLLDLSRQTEKELSTKRVIGSTFRAPSGLSENMTASRRGNEDL